MSHYKLPTIALNMGSATLRVLQAGRELLRIPTVVAVEPATQRAVAFGDEAFKMLAHRPQTLELCYPLANGSVLHPSYACGLLEAALTRYLAKAQRLLGYTLLLAVPAGVGEADLMRLQAAAKAVGARHVKLVDEVLAAAQDVGAADNNLNGFTYVVDVGYALTDIAMVAWGQIIVAESLRVAGRDCDRAIAALARGQLALRSAEEVKRRIGSAPDHHLSAKRRPMRGALELPVLGGPVASLALEAQQVSLTLREPLEKIAAAMSRVRAAAPLPLQHELARQGLILCGGSAHLRHLARYLAEALDVPVKLAEDPEDCVVKGALRLAVNDAPERTSAAQSWRLEPPSQHLNYA